jgi:hypothetical protein
MDIDRLARMLGASPTRRGITRVLTGMTLAGTLTAAHDAAARRKKKCKACRFRKRGRCRGKKPNETPCNGDGKCFDGACIVKPQCDGVGAQCDPSGPVNCCNGCFIDTCQPGSANDECFVTADCFAGLTCIAFRCREPQ